MSTTGIVEEKAFLEKERKGDRHEGFEGPLSGV
jgi:hypothetical protein